MNTRSITLIIAVITALNLCGISTAQTPHVGDVAELGEGTPPKMQKVTYLGVTAKPVDTALRAQLNLPDGVGLTVMTVDHKGPAAGDLQVNDVIQKLDDQLLIDAHQLVALIRLHHPGDTVVLTLVREAKPVQVSIKLGEKEKVVSPAGDSDRADNLPDGKPLEDQVWAVPFDPQLPLGPTQMAMSFKDDAYSAIVKTSKDGHKELIVKDIANNNVVADGPIDTPQEWQKFSPDIRQHLDVMHKMLLQQQK